MIGEVDKTNFNFIDSTIIGGSVQKNSVTPIQKPEFVDEKVKPIRDEYISSRGKEEHTGLYKVIYDEHGNKKIVYDKIEKERAVQGNDERKDVQDIQKAEEKKEMGYVNTGAVDREIETLKKKRDNLLKEIMTFRDAGMSATLENLQRELEQVERELMQKDNDGYRKQNAFFSKGVALE